MSVLSSPKLLRLVQLGLIMLFLGLGVTVSLTTSEGPDEVAHFYFIRFVAAHGRLPLDRTELVEAGYKADLPPLFHLLAGLAGQGLDLESPPRLKTTRDNTRLQLVTGHENITAWRMIKTEDPLRGEILLWHLGRWSALLGGLAGLLLTYRLLRRLWPEATPYLALGGAALLAFLPPYTYVSGVISYEPLVGALLAAYFLLLYRTLHQPERELLYLALGLLLGLAAATRQTGWSLLPVVPGLLLWLAYCHSWPWSASLHRLGLFSLGLLLTLGPWLLYMMVAFNQVAELGWLRGLLTPLVVGDGSQVETVQLAGLVTGGQIGQSATAARSDPVWWWAWRFFREVWGPGWTVWLMLAGWGLALAGLVRRWSTFVSARRLWLSLLLGQLGLLLLLPFLRYFISGDATTAFAQHILFPAGVILLALLLEGLRAWLAPARLAGLMFVLAAIFLGQNVALIRAQMAPRFPLQSVPLAVEEPVAAPLPGLSLLNFATHSDAQQLTVTLQWRTEEQLNDDYRVELTLLDAAGQLQAVWFGQPLAGRYPSRAWLSGDRVRQTVSLPLAGLSSGAYDLHLRLFTSGGTVEGEPVALGSVDLAPGPPQFAQTLPLADASPGFSLWPAPETPVLYRENATVLMVVQSKAADLRFSLVDPTGQTHEPDRQAGHLLNFVIQPHFPAGSYHLRAEQWQGDSLLAQADSDPLLMVETELRQFSLDTPPAQPVQADFAGYVTLLGYDLPAGEVQPGQALPLTLYWQAQRIIGADLIVFNTLVAESGAAWPGRDRLPREVYSPMFWTPGEIVSDPFAVPIDPAVPAGRYSLHVGLYLPVGEAPVLLPLVQEGQFSQITHIEVGPILVGESP